MMEVQREDAPAFRVSVYRVGDRDRFLVSTSLALAQDGWTVRAADDPEEVVETLKHWLRSVKTRPEATS